MVNEKSSGRRFRDLPWRARMVVISPFAFVLAIGLGCHPAWSQTNAPPSGDSAQLDESVSSVVTADGTLEAQNTIVSIGNTILQNFREASTVSIASPITAAGMVTGAVVQVSSGGVACPAQYAVVDHTGGKWVVSDQFGNCSDVPTFTFSNDTIVIAFSQIGSAKDETWAYRSGNLRKLR